MNYFFPERLLTSFHEIEEALLNKYGVIPADVKTTVSNSLSAIHTECFRAKLGLTIKLINDILPLVSTQTYGQTFEQLRPRIIELRHRLRHELPDARFIAITKEKFPLLELYQLPLSPEIAQRFPRSNDEIKEALACYALERNTACVFHLMRALEAALRTFSEELDVYVGGPRSWGEILKKAEEKLQTHAKASQDKSIKDAGHEAIVYLRTIKEAWRNPTMHMERSYNEAQAAEIINATKTFLQNLGLVVKSLGPPHGKN